MVKKVFFIIVRFFLFLFLISLLPAFVSSDTTLFKKMKSFFGGNTSWTSRFWILLKRLFMADFGKTFSGKTNLEIILQSLLNSIEVLLPVFLLSALLCLLFLFIKHLSFESKFISLIWFPIEKFFLVIYYLPYFVTSVILIYFFSIFLLDNFSFSFPILGNYGLILLATTLLGCSYMYFQLSRGLLDYEQKEDILYLKILGFSPKKIFFTYLFPYLKAEFLGAFFSIWRVMWGILIVLEILFSWPGLGLKVLDAVKSENISQLYLAIISIFVIGMLVEILFYIILPFKSFDEVNSTIRD